MADVSCGLLVPVTGPGSSECFVHPDPAEQTSCRNTLNSHPPTVSLPSNHRRTIPMPAPRPSIGIVSCRRSMPSRSASTSSKPTACMSSAVLPTAESSGIRCYQDLMARLEERLHQEAARLGGHYAHVHEESIDSKHDDRSGDVWLRGRLKYLLLRRPGVN